MQQAFIKNSTLSTQHLFEAHGLIKKNIPYGEGFVVHVLSQAVAGYRKMRGVFWNGNLP